MKRVFVYSMLFCSSLVTINTFALDIKITNSQAQALYQSLSVPEDGAAGHVYKQGKSVLCRRTNVDMDDAKGKPIPSEDPRRYVCIITFNEEGLAKPGQ